MKIQSYIDMTSDNANSIGLTRTANGCHLNITKGAVILDIDMTKSQMLKIKRFLDAQVQYIVKDDNS